MRSGTDAKDERRLALVFQELLLQMRLQREGAYGVVVAAASTTLIAMTMLMAIWWWCTTCATRG